MLFRSSSRARTSPLLVRVCGVPVVHTLGVAAVLTGFACAAIVGCSSDDPTSPGNADGGTADGGTADGGTADASGTGSDAAEAGPSINACSSFTDRSAGGAVRVLKWDFSISSAPERCIRIKAGQSITFGNGAGGAADFGTHPVGPQGGDTPNPVSEVDTSSGEVEFPKAGTFGFACVHHPAMIGAVEVVP